MPDCVSADERCSIFAEHCNAKNSLESGASRVVAVNHLSHQLQCLEPFRRRFPEPIRFFITVVQLRHRKVRAIQLCLGQLVHGQSYGIIEQCDSSNRCSLARHPVAYQRPAAERVLAKTFSCMNSGAQISALRRLAFAELAFRQAHLLCTHIESLGPRNIASLWVPLLAGVVVTYMKPFGRCDGLGPLPSSYRRFPVGSAHKQTHDDIAAGRKWTYAHRDLLNSPKLLSTFEEQEAVSEVVLQVVTKDSTTIRIREPAWHPETLPRILELCEFQISRIAADLQPLLKSLAGTKSYKAGKYVLGRDFP